MANQEWRPIDTAPKDKTILVCSHIRELGKSGRVHPIFAIAWYGAGGVGWRTPEGDRVSPTHWMPLPAPPTQESR